MRYLAVEEVNAFIDTKVNRLIENIKKYKREKQTIFIEKADTIPVEEGEDVKTHKIYLVSNSYMINNDSDLFEKTDIFTQIDTVLFMYLKGLCYMGQYPYEIWAFGNNIELTNLFTLYYNYKYTNKLL